MAFFFLTVAVLFNILTDFEHTAEALRGRNGFRKHVVELKIIEKNSTNIRYTAGTVIHAVWLLTTAHEIVIKPIKRIDVRHEETGGLLEHVKVIRAHIHPRFRWRPPINDISLLRLNQSIFHGHPGIKAIKIASQGVRLGDRAIMVGYEYYQEFYTFPRTPNTAYKTRATRPIVLIDNSTLDNATLTTMTTTTTTKATTLTTRDPNINSTGNSSDINMTLIATIPTHMDHIKIKIRGDPIYYTSETVEYYDLIPEKTVTTKKRRSKRTRSTKRTKPTTTTVKTIRTRTKRIHFPVIMGTKSPKRLALLRRRASEEYVRIVECPRGLTGSQFFCSYNHNKTVPHEEDNGGPLIDYRKELIGISSYQSFYTFISSVDYFVNIREMMPWINRITGIKTAKKQQN